MEREEEEERIDGEDEEEAEEGKEGEKEEITKSPNSRGEDRDRKVSGDQGPCKAS